MSFDPCQRPEAEALSSWVAELVVLDDVCANAGAAINAEPRAAAAKNFESIVILLRCLLPDRITRRRRNGSGARHNKVVIRPRCAHDTLSKTRSGCIGPRAVSHVRDRDVLWRPEVGADRPLAQWL